MSQDRPDLTRPPDLLRERRTGPLRMQRPIYVDLLPPCNDACPPGENTQAWLGLAQGGRFEEAWRTLVADNPLPAVHGRLCYRPCEDSCNRRQLDSEVTIHAVERFLGDAAIEQGWRHERLREPTGKRILMVGGGPSGLSAAYHLARLGHAVEIRRDSRCRTDAGRHDAFRHSRLPHASRRPRGRDQEGRGGRRPDHHRSQGRGCRRVDEGGAFDACFIAVGAHLSKRTEIPARGAGRMMDAVSFLRDVETHEAPRLGRVAVYGGGNTAIDTARVARRLGAAEAMIIYRRDRAHVPAHEFEAAEAEAEGVRIHWLRTIRSIDRTTLMVEVMELDEQGRPKPTGRFETLEADSLVMALGQDVDTDFLRKVAGVALQADGTVVVDRNMMTGRPGLFAGGDMVPSERTVTVAAGHGKQAARNIDAWLRGATYDQPPRHDLATFEKLHVWYYTDAKQRQQKALEISERSAGFDEVVAGLSEGEAQYEARRCLSCGNCFECDGCYGACPEHAIVKLGPGKRYRYDYDLCTGCAVCFEQCPCHAIEMIPEPAE